MRQFCFLSRKKWKCHPLKFLSFSRNATVKICPIVYNCSYSNVISYWRVGSAWFHLILTKSHGEKMSDRSEITHSHKISHYRYCRSTGFYLILTESHGENMSDYSIITLILTESHNENIVEHQGSTSFSRNLTVKIVRYFYDCSHSHGISQWKYRRTTGFHLILTKSHG